MMTYPRESCCFATGHRDMPDHKKSQILGRVRELCAWLIEHGVTHFYAGGARGFDMWFACVVLELRRLCPQITLTVLLPSKDYTGRFTPEERMLQSKILAAADEVVTVPTPTGREPALVRDDALIEAGRHCICYLNENRLTRRGGTAYTVRHAAARGCKIYAVWQAGDYETRAYP